MRKIIIALLITLFPASIVHADRGDRCTHIAGVAADTKVRMMYGESPQQALSWYKKHGVNDGVLSLSTKKKIINMVYFDPRLFNLAPGRIYMLVFNSCMEGPDKPFQPLR